MKKYLKIVIPLTFLAILGYFGFQIVSKINHKKEVANNIKSIPTFNFENTKGGNFTQESVQAGIPTIFVYFSSECEFCNEEAQMIQDNVSKFKNVQLVFVSFEKKQVIASFAKKYKLDSYVNFYFLCDSKASFATTFDVKSLPCLVLYDKNQNLIEKIKGQMKVETILKKLENRK